MGMGGSWRGLQGVVVKGHLVMSQWVKGSKHWPLRALMLQGLLVWGLKGGAGDALSWEGPNRKEREDQAK